MSKERIKETCETIALQIITALDNPPEDGTRWVMPWDKSLAGGMPMNIITGRAYGGNFNGFMLTMAGIQYGDQRWAGFGQWKKSGNLVRKGETGTPIFFPKLACGTCGKPCGFAKKCKPCGANLKAKGATKFIGFGSSYTFNNQQTVNPLPTVDVKEVDPNVGYEAAAALVEGIEADFRTGGARAFYSPREDYLMVPAPGAFLTVADFWATVIHEHGHWTGAKGRLNRKGITDFSGFGSEAYAYEELVAEIGAAFTCAYLGIKREGLMDNHVAYLTSWKKALKDDPTVIQRAANEAGQVMRYLINKGEGSRPTA